MKSFKLFLVVFGLGLTTVCATVGAQELTRRCRNARLDHSIPTCADVVQVLERHPENVKMVTVVLKDGRSLTVVP